MCLWKSDSRYKSYYSERETLVAAINREIYPDNQCDLKRLCKKIRKELPPIHWQLGNIEEQKTILNERHQELIKNYGDWEYLSMNEKLRKNPSMKAELNDVMKQLTPLPKDIIVYRLVSPGSWMPKHKNFVSNGYLSTTIDIIWTMETIFDDSEKYENSSDSDSDSDSEKEDINWERWSLFKIHVPKGTHCILLPYYESELLFAHGLKLKLLNKSIRPIITIDGHSDYEILDIMQYEYQLIDKSNR